MNINTPLRHCNRLNVALPAYLFLIITSYQDMIVSHGFLLSKNISYRTNTAIHVETVQKKGDKDDDDDNKIKIFGMTEVDMEDSFSCSNFAATKCWGTSPLLMRGAFRSQSKSLMAQMDQVENDDVFEINEENPPNISIWPTWDEVIELALDEDAESRLITHIPEDPWSWRLTLGPFEDDELKALGKISSSSTVTIDHDTDTILEPNEKWTMVLNDVDRFHPPLFDFITEHFSFIPEWRKDDGQISLSNIGGGIGPHTDDYDVFLIQMSGKRRWDIGKRNISVKEELNGLRAGLDVRILNFWDDEIKNGFVDSFLLEPGDVIYLPPRFAHCGTAISDGCMTLSVGLRAPSAKEMMTRMAEYVDMNVIDGNFVKRYTDADLLNDPHASIVNLSEVTPEVKTKAKNLLKDAILSLLDDDLFFDQFLGEIVTKSNRMRSNYPLPLDQLDTEELQSLGALGDARHCVKLMLSCKASLFAAEGIAWAHSILKQDKSFHLCRLFVDGRKWEIDFSSNDVNEKERIIKLLGIITTEKELCGEKFSQYAPIPVTIQHLLEDLVQEGYLYGSDVYRYEE